MVIMSVLSIVEQEGEISKNGRSSIVVPQLVSCGEDEHKGLSQFCKTVVATITSQETSLFFSKLLIIQ